jgi:transposase-like protein
MEWRASMAKIYKRYPMRFRERAVERMRLGENVSQLARELGVNRVSLYNWKRKSEGHRARVRGKERDERDLRIESANPDRCQDTTVSGLTMRSACFHPDQNFRAKTQKSVSNTASFGLGCFRLGTASC